MQTIRVFETSLTGRRKYLHDLILRKLQSNESVRSDIVDIIANLNDAELEEFITEYEAKPDGDGPTSREPQYTTNQKRTFAVIRRNYQSFEALDDEDLEESLENESIAVREDGLIEPGWLDSKSRRIIGRLPIVVYHHTSSALLPEIKRTGLRSGVYNVSRHEYESAGVYVTLRYSGNDVDTYHSAAVAAFGGRPVTLLIRTTVPELQSDPDDAHLQSGSYQYVLPEVEPRDIIETV